MKYLLLWSGDVAGMKKVAIPAIENRGIIGHYDGGQLVRPDLDSVRAALPYRLRAAFDRATIWYDKRQGDYPAVVQLYRRRVASPIVIYLQPVGVA